MLRQVLTRPCRRNLDAAATLQAWRLTMRNLLVIFLLALTGGTSFAQGVRDPSTPNAGAVYQVNPPSQPSRPTATPNIPPASAAPPLGVRRAYRSYRGYYPGSRGRYRR